MVVEGSVGSGCSVRLVVSLLLDWRVQPIGPVVGSPIGVWTNKRNKNKKLKQS